MSKSKATDSENEISSPCAQVELHKALRLAGKTEATINRQKIPSITAMGWAKNGAFIIEADKIHRLPSAAVADSILE